MISVVNVGSKDNSEMVGSVVSKVSEKCRTLKA